MTSRRSTPRPRRFDGTSESVWRHIVDLPVEPSGCILWIAGTATNNGYGRFNLRQPDGSQRGILAHRFAWSQVNGPIPVGMEVLHSCDIPRCVNPEHLSIGTHAENMRQMAERGRVKAAYSVNGGRPLPKPCLSCGGLRDGKKSRCSACRKAESKSVNHSGLCPVHGTPYDRIYARKGGGVSRSCSTCQNAHQALARHHRATCGHPGVDVG